MLVVQSQPKRKRPRRRQRKAAQGQMRIPMPQPIPSQQLMNATNAPLAILVDQAKRKRTRRPRRKGNTARKTKSNNLLTSKISLCAARYASALLDPENTPVGACVPWGFPTPSQKGKGYTSGRMALGTTGYGFVTMQRNMSNDGTAVSYTTATSVGGAGTSLGAFTNLGTSTYANLPYPAASFGANSGSVRGRSVAQILKVRYAGTEANRNGTVYMYEDAQHADLSGRSPAGITGSGIRSSERPRMDGSWHTVLLSGPATEVEAEFGTSSLLGSAYCCAVIVGTAGDIYDFESFHVVEFASANIQGLGPAETDVEGYSLVTGATRAHITQTPLVAEEGPGVFRQILESAGVGVNQFVKSYGPKMVFDVLSASLLPGGNPRLALEL